MADSQKSTYMHIYTYMYTHIYIKNLSPMANSQKTWCNVGFYSAWSREPTFWEISRDDKSSQTVWWQSKAFVGGMRNVFVRGMSLDDKSSQTAFVIPLCSWEVSVPSVFVRGMCSWEVISNCSCHTSVFVGGVCSLCVCGRCVFPLCSWEVCVPFVFVGGIPRPVGYLTGRQVISNCSCHTSHEHITLWFCFWRMCSTLHSGRAGVQHCRRVKLSQKLARYSIYYRKWL